MKSDSIWRINMLIKGMRQLKIIHFTTHNKIHLENAEQFEQFENHFHHKWAIYRNSRIESKRYCLQFLTIRTLTRDPFKRKETHEYNESLFHPLRNSCSSDLIKIIREHEWNLSFRRTNSVRSVNRSLRRENRT